MTSLQRVNVTISANVIKLAVEVLADFEFLEFFYESSLKIGLNMGNLGENFRSLIIYFVAIDDDRKSTNAET